MKVLKQLSPAKKELRLDQLQIHMKDDFAILPFDERTIDFLNTISRVVLHDEALNKLPMYAALGFWLRKANIGEIIKRNTHLVKPYGYAVEPLGVVFHICPSNVDTMFVYSLAISLLLGNKNIVRISSRLDSDSIDYFINKLNTVLATPEYHIFSDYLLFITYEHDDEISGYLSLLADARIIWGGDQTINLFRKYRTKPRTKDIVFADRLSIAVFKSSAYLSLSGKEKRELARQFYNDSYTFDQKGCSSPQTVFVLGDDHDNNLFLNELYNHLLDLADQFYSNDIYSLASLKFNFLSENALDNKIGNVLFQSNYVVFAEMDEKDQIHKSCGGGFFYINKINNLSQIESYLTKKIQTLSYFGLNDEDLQSIVYLSYTKGIDRIVPIGTALNFDFIWDGYNLLDELCCKKRVV